MRVCLLPPLTHTPTYTPTVVPAGTKDVPVGEPLAVLVYNEKDVGAFSHLAPYRPEGAAAGAGGDGVDAGGSVGPADGTALLKFIHKLVRGGQINDKGTYVRRSVGLRIVCVVSSPSPVPSSTRPLTHPP